MCPHIFQVSLFVGPLTIIYRARASYRKAQIEAKRNAEAARRRERELLLGKADGRRKLRGANQLSYVWCLVHG